MRSTAIFPLVRQDKTGPNVRKVYQCCKTCTITHANEARTIGEIYSSFRLKTQPTRSDGNEKQMVVSPFESTHPTWKCWDLVPRKTEAFECRQVERLRRGKSGGVSSWGHIVIECLDGTYARAQSKHKRMARPKPIRTQSRGYPRATIRDIRCA